MRSLTAKLAVAVAAIAAGLSFFAQGASAAPIGAGLAAPIAAETLVAPVQWGPGYGYERRRVYRDDGPGYGRGRGNAYGRRVYRDDGPGYGRGNAYGRRDRFEGRRSYDSGYRGRPGVYVGPGGGRGGRGGGERCFLDGAGRKVCR